MNKNVLLSLASLLLCFVSLSSKAQSPVELRVNLGGYPTDMPKTALILSKTALNEPVMLLKNAAGEIVGEYQPQLSENAWHPFTHYYSLDFSDFCERGSYYFELRGAGLRSRGFDIGPYPAWQNDVVSFIRSQRCGYNPHIKAYCHQHDGLSFFGSRPDSSRIDATGGWHDAGDQLKYLITSSNTTARLLMSYQMKPCSFPDEYDEKGLKGGNKLPDILDEARWGLEWILKLHPGPDELYHQVADDRDHRGFKLPQEDNADYGWGVNSYRPVYFATGRPQGLSKYQSKASGIANLAGRSAASLALGYEVFSMIEGYEDFAHTCLKAARELYDMGKGQEGYQQGNSYGAPYRYEENTWADDMEWAAALLYKISREPGLLEDARRYAKIIGTWSWMERDTASHYEMYPFVNMGHYVLWQVGTDADKEQMIAYYDHNLARIRERAAENPYGTGHLFIWCSNNLAAAVATQAMLYEEMSGSKKYRSLMQNHLNWLLGLNPWNTSMITGLPENADYPEDVHMPFWVINKETIKGSLVDGPLWATIHDGMLGIELSEPDEYEHLQPGHIKYWDDWLDYSTNEPTLDGSAELLMILTRLSRGYGDVIDRHGAHVRSDTMERNIYLCFTGHDLYDGFEHVLELMETRGVKGSFFLTGDFVRSRQDLVKAIQKGGHYIGAHSDRHLLYCDWDNRDSLLLSEARIKADIEHNLQVLRDIGINPSYFMPPYEWYNSRVVEIASTLDQVSVSFSPGTRSNADYTTPGMSNYLSSREIMESIYTYEHNHGLNGFHLLIHPGTSSLRKDKLYLQLDDLISDLQEKDYRFCIFY